MMDEFKKQLDNNLRQSITAFLTDPDYVDIKNLYRENFDTIYSYIKKFGHQLSIENIANIDKSISQKISNEILLLKQINRAIADNQLKIKDLQ